MEGLAVLIFECDECVVCLEGKPNAVFSPCRHRCCCTACSELVEKSKQPCPLCRTPIADVLYYKDHAAVDTAVVPIDQADIDAFKQERREEYVKRLKAPVTGDACFRGKDKLARSVASEVLSELEVRQRETAGTERVTAKPSTVEFSVEGHDLVVQYKLGRSKRREQHALLSLDDAAQGLLECLGGDKVSLLDVATHYPEYYWNLKYGLANDGKGVSLSDYLEQDLKILQKKR